MEVNIQKNKFITGLVVFALISFLFLGVSLLVDGAGFKVGAVVISLIISSVVIVLSLIFLIMQLVQYSKDPNAFGVPNNTIFNFVFLVIYLFITIALYWTAILMD